MKHANRKKTVGRKSSKRKTTRRKTHGRKLRRTIRKRTMRGGDTATDHDNWLNNALDIVDNGPDQSIRYNCPNIIKGVNAIIKFIKWHYVLGYTDKSVDCKQDITALKKELKTHITTALSEIRESVRVMPGIAYRLGRTLPDLPTLSP